jgi:sugar/nucleoside kinase (ribokinase family)
MLSSMNTEVVTLGEAMRLLLAEPGVALRRAHTFTSSVAGAETNVAVGLARLGHAVRWLSRVGADPSGAHVLATLRADGVDVSCVEVDPDRYTGFLACRPRTCAKQVSTARGSCKIARAVTADGSWTQESLVTRIVDPVGAGDALTSGYLSAWLRGTSPAEALRVGAACAALVVGTRPTWKACPTEENWPRH